MKISVVDYYGPLSAPQKDPITIPIALAERGHDVTLISVDDWSGDLFGLPVSRLSAFDSALSVGQRPDAVIAITRFDPRLTPMIRRAKVAGCRVVIKGDTDGTIGHPLRPNYLRARPILGSPFNTLRHLKWRLPLSSLIRPRLEQLAIADATVVESPGAATNLCLVLQSWGMSECIKAIRTLPNPVAPEVLSLPVHYGKDRVIVSVGRWDDYVKGPDVLWRTINKLLAVRNDYKFLIIGPGSERIRHQVNARHLSMVTATGAIDFLAAHNLVGKSRILLSTSLIESFSFAAAEAVCAGSSIVVPPIESLIYLSGGGEFGSIASGFSAESLTSALLREISEWEAGGRNIFSTADYWRAKLSPDRIGALWETLLIDQK